jgi:lipopolysaccharide transport system ATP-binding protein
MKARLGFAVAAQMNPDVLLIDEVLAVGDIKFRGKCYRRIAELRQAGTCIIFVSHSILSILATCNTGLFLHRGQMLASGNIGDVVAAYEVHSLLEQTTTENAAQNGHFTKNTSLRIETVALQDGTGAACDYLTVGQYATLCISGSATEPLQNVIFSFLIRDCAREDTTSLYFDSETEGIAFDVPTGRFETRLEIPFFGLGPGVYLLKVNARLKNFYVLDADESVRFKVVRSPAFAQGAMFQLPHQWHFETVPSLSAQPTDNV